MTIKRKEDLITSKALRVEKESVTSIDRSTPMGVRGYGGEVGRRSDIKKQKERTTAAGTAEREDERKEEGCRVSDIEVDRHQEASREATPRTN